MTRVWLHPIKRLSIEVDEAGGSAQIPRDCGSASPNSAVNLPSRMGNQKLKWTSEEEEALKAGVAKYGAGKWKNILVDSEFKHKLSNRSNVDLKVFDLMQCLLLLLVFFNCFVVFAIFN